MDEEEVWTMELPRPLEVGNEEDEEEEADAERRRRRTRSQLRICRKTCAMLLVLTCFDAFVTCESPCGQHRLGQGLRISPLFPGVECATQAEIEQHLNLGMQMLAKGQYSDALSHFHAAVGESGHNVYSLISFGVCVGGGGGL